MKSNVRVSLYVYKEIRNISDKGQRYITECTAAALTNSGSGHKSSLSESTSKNNSRINLLKLDLACFTGDVLKFMTYWDQFRYVVHENQELLEVQNLHICVPLQRKLLCMLLKALT